VEIVHGDMLGLLLEKIFLHLPSYFGHVARLPHVEIESLFQQLFQLPSSDPALSRATFAIVSSRRKIISSYGIGLGALVLGASGDGLVRKRSTSDEKRDLPD
jgi:hypothetical protein